jgi:hypothetical protein
VFLCRNWFTTWADTAQSKEINMNKNDQTVKISTYLKEKGCSNPEDAVAPINTLLMALEKENFELCPMSSIDQELLKKTVSEISGKVISNIAFFSLNNPFPKPDWMSQEMYDHDYKEWDIFSGELLSSLSCSGIEFSINFDVLELFDTEQDDDIHQLMLLFHEINPHRIMEEKIFGKIRASDDFYIFDWIVDILSNYLAFCLLNDQVQAERFKILIGFLHQCIVYRLKIDDPETLLVICL